MTPCRWRPAPARPRCSCASSWGDMVSWGRRFSAVRRRCARASSASIAGDNPAGSAKRGSRVKSKGYPWVSRAPPKLARSLHRVDDQRQRSSGPTPLDRSVLRNLLHRSKINHPRAAVCRPVDPQIDDATPGRTILAVMSRRPAAATRISASFVTEARSPVFEWRLVAVASFARAGAQRRADDGRAADDHRAPAGNVPACSGGRMTPAGVPARIRRPCGSAPRLRA